MDVTNGYIVADADRAKFRTWGMSGPEWTDIVDDALWFARREDAEKFCEDDEDAWYVLRALEHKANMIVQARRRFQRGG